jgi:hypothetical protein
MVQTEAANRVWEQLTGIFWYYQVDGWLAVHVVPSARLLTYMHDQHTVQKLCIYI